MNRNFDSVPCALDQASEDVTPERTTAFNYQSNRHR
jgi:hypothetical protein